MNSCLGRGRKEDSEHGPWLPGRLWLPSPECPTLPLASRLEWGGEIEKRGDKKVVENWSKAVIYFFSKLITLIVNIPWP